MDNYFSHVGFDADEQFFWEGVIFLKKFQTNMKKRVIGRAWTVLQAGRTIRLSLELWRGAM